MNKKNCQRCGINFECLPEDIQNCGCSKVELQNSTLEYLSKTRYDCLCNKCLSELDKLVEKSIALKENSKKGELTEDVHFYHENRLVVFTELFHISRGYCCQSGCRHCGYGFKK